MGRHQYLLISSKKRITILTHSMLSAAFLILGLQVLCAFAAPGLSVGADPTTTKECGEFVVDQCYNGNSTDQFPFETRYNTNIEFCQYLCTHTYVKVCQFMISDRRQNKCQVWKANLETYEQTCTIVGGPKPSAIPKTTKCETDECSKFKNEYCIFEGNVLDHFNLIDNEQTCADVCNHVDECQYYVYDKATKDCELRDSPKFNCDILRITKDVITNKLPTYSETCDTNSNDEPKKTTKDA